MRKIYDYLYYQRPYDPSTDQPLNADHANAITEAIAAGKQIDVSSQRVWADGLYIARLVDDQEDCCC